jgi:hypothetical protein
VERCDHFIKGVHCRWARQGSMRAAEVLDQALHVLTLAVLFLRPLILAHLVFEHVLGRLKDKDETALAVLVLVADSAG